MGILGRTIHFKHITILLVFVTLACYVETAVVSSKCSASDSTNKVLPSEMIISENLKMWHTVVLIFSFGVIALFVSIIHRIIRSFVYYDAHLVDTFFDAGGDMNFALIATNVVTKVSSISLFIIPIKHIMDAGIVGHFWFAAAIGVPVILFSIVVAEIRVKAPGAKTFLQVIHARYGRVTHFIIMIFAILINVIIIGTVTMDGANLISSMTEGLGMIETLAVLLVSTLLYTVVGGVGGAIYFSYFSSILVIAITMLSLTDVLFNNLKRDENMYGDMTALYEKLKCVNLDNGNELMSALTFVSWKGMINGVIIFLATFANLFTNQSYWQTGIAAKPHNGVWGYITGGLCSFAVPFCFSYGIGLVYWAMVVDSGLDHLVVVEDSLGGKVLVIIMQKLWDGVSGRDGSLMMLSLIAITTITSLNSEILSLASILVYDVHQTIVSPFQSKTKHVDTPAHVKTAQRNDEFLAYNKRTSRFKHYVIIGLCLVVIPITLALNASGTSSWYLYCVIAILANCVVAPVVLSVVWYRITWHGVMWGVISGFISSFIVWLVVPMAMETEVAIKQFAEYTSDESAIIAATATGLLMGGLSCILVSLSCGGCDRELQEDEEWEKTREIDNVIFPWSVKYAPDIKGTGLAKGRPHYYTVRRVFKYSEASAYIVGVFLAVSILLIWPSMMLMMKEFSPEFFNEWSWSVVAVGVVVGMFLIIAPIILETVQICSQAFHNRRWIYADNRERLEEEHSENDDKLPPILPNKTPEPVDTDSDLQSTFGRQNSIDDDTKERWKTFIHLD